MIINFPSKHERIARKRAKAGFYKEADIIRLLNEPGVRGQLAVSRAIVRLYERQTADEKATRSANHTNGRGFSGRHAKQGTRLARWVLNGYKTMAQCMRIRPLTGHHLELGREICLAYRRQLVEIANGNL